MKPFAFLGCAFACMIIFGDSAINAIPTVAPVARNCGNGIFCAPFQTCMSNATGAGVLYACSPLFNAVRCMDARFSCPASFACADNSRCVAPSTSDSDAVVNIDAFEVATFRDFGSGLKPTALSICGPITTTFRLPNFCTCRDSKYGGELICAIGLQNYITIGASAWIMPCASPSNFGYTARASLMSGSRSVGNTWTAAFTINTPIPGASFGIGVVNVGARVELSGVIAQFIISAKLAIGVCAKLGIGIFSKEICNPSALSSWLPVTVLNGPRYDFSRFC